MATSFFYIYVMATSFFYIYVMATSFFYIYIDIYIDICIDIDIYIAIYKLTERPVVLLNAIFLPLLSKKSQCDKIFKLNYKKRDDFATLVSWSVYHLLSVRFVCHPS